MHLTWLHTVFIIQGICPAAQGWGRRGASICANYNPPVKVSTVFQNLFAAPFCETAGAQNKLV